VTGDELRALLSDQDHWLALLLWEEWERLS